MDNSNFPLLLLFAMAFDSTKVLSWRPAKNVAAMQKIPKPIIFAILFAYLLIIFRAMFIGAGNGRAFLRGDAVTEYLSYNGVRYFYDHGFLPTYFLTNYGYTDEAFKAKRKEFDKSQIYLHYPPLAENFTALTALAFRSTDMRILRIVPIVFSFLLLYFILKTLRLLHKEEKEVWISFAVLLLSNYFIAWADNTSKFLYEEIFKWAILYILLRRFSQTPRNWDIPVLAFLFFCLANLSYDSLVVSIILVIGLTIYYRKKLFALEIVIPCAAATAGIVLHFLQVVLFLGSWQAFFDDIQNTLARRVLGQHVHSETPPVTFGSWLLHIFFYNINRIERFFLVPGWALVAFAFVLCRQWQKEKDPRFVFFGIFLVAAIGWNLTMWQHAMVHVWIAKNWGIWVALVAGPGLLWLYSVLKQYESQAKWQFALQALLAIYILGMAITQQVWELYLRYGFLYPWLEKTVS